MGLWLEFRFCCFYIFHSQFPPLSPGMESMANKSVALVLPRQGSLDAHCVAQISSPPQQLINFGTPEKSGSTPFVGSSYTPCVDPAINPFEGMVFDDLDAAEEFYKTYVHSAGFGVRVGPHTDVRVWNPCWSAY